MDDASRVIRHVTRNAWARVAIRDLPAMRRRRFLYIPSV
ncbi:hypothetical protein BSIN_4560 [Burkholderia singularis]|uniref:Uncharacterized protein n=1 Tax=Burkholderia singularis TaxID=1503053 RepID=A0A238HBC1_9BURK|nr:hypothetical protein BSIN_4560 [Burkholderia singularis]